MKNSKSIFVGGINGSGKTTVLNSLCRNRLDYTFVKGSKRLMERLGIRNSDYEKLRNLPDDLVYAETDKLIRSLIEENSKKIGYHLLDAHYLNIRNGVVSDCIGAWIKLFAGLVYFRASPATILRRIKKDEGNKSRDRKLFPATSRDEERLELLGRYDKIAIVTMRRFAAELSVPSVVIDSSNSNPDKAMKELDKFIKGL